MTFQQYYAQPYFKCSSNVDAPCFRPAAQPVERLTNGKRVEAELSNVIWHEVYGVGGRKKTPLSSQNDSFGTNLCGSASLSWLQMRKTVQCYFLEQLQHCELSGSKSSKTATTLWRLLDHSSVCVLICLSPNSQFCSDVWRVVGPKFHNVAKVMRQHLLIQSWLNQRMFKTTQQ